MGLMGLGFKNFGSTVKPTVQKMLKIINLFLSFIQIYKRLILKLYLTIDDEFLFVRQNQTRVWSHE